MWGKKNVKMENLFDPQVNGGGNNLRNIIIDFSLPVDQMGRWLVAGGAVVGLGALCYYGLGLSDEVGAIDKAV